MHNAPGMWLAALTCVTSLDITATLNLNPQHSNSMMHAAMPCNARNLDSEHPAFEPHEACLCAMRYQQTLLEMDLGLDSGHLCPMDYGVFTTHLIYLITEKIYLTFPCLCSSACEHQISVSLNYILLEHLI